MAGTFKNRYFAVVNGFSCVAFLKLTYNNIKIQMTHESWKGRNILSITDFTTSDIQEFLNHTRDIKKYPKQYSDALRGKKISEEDADMLIEYATNLIDSL